MPILRFVVPPEWNQKSLSAFLRGAHGLSGTTLRAARRAGEGLTMDGALIRTVDPVRAGSVVLVALPDEERSYRPYTGGLAATLLYEDDDLLILDKPAGMACHPSKGHPDDTLANYCAGLPGMAGRAFRPIGRLDRDTSGTVLCAKHAHSAYWLGFSAHRPQKIYLALLCGVPSEQEFTVDAPLSRDGDEEAHRRSVTPDGLSAVTHCRVLLQSKDYSLAALRLETGRTHQIRAHMAYLGCPLAGDVLYGGDTALIGRQALHCWRSAVQSPENRRIAAFAPLPVDFAGAARTAFGIEAFDAMPAVLEKGMVSW